MQIKCRVPAKARYGTGEVTVRTTADKSNAKSFRVKRWRRTARSKTDALTRARLDGLGGHRHGAAAVSAR